ncbi:MAG TPA: hypothetical protein VNF99_09520 [Stellaceae bacterium]|nr:hypothetical protein [Stellaceae bacterium]
MPSKFWRGAVAYTANGRSYTVEAVEDGTVYCTADSGAETEFAESAMLTEAEWAARASKHSLQVYDRLKQSRLYAAPAAKLDRAAAVALLAKIERLTPGILDFAAFSIAARILEESGEAELAARLSIAKCRAVFEGASAETRASLLAAILGTPAEMLVNAARLGDNLMRALVEKGLAARAEEFEAFGDRPRS